MESSALATTSLECGDGCAIATDTFPDESAGSSTANQCSSSTAYFSSSAVNGPASVAPRWSSPESEWTAEDLSVYEAASVLCSLKLNRTQTERQCTGVNSFDYHAESTGNSLCRCAMASSKSVPACLNCASNHTVVAADENHIDKDADVLVMDHISLTVPETNKLENGARLPDSANDSVVVDSSTTRCRHATADRCSTVQDYAAVSCDIVFSDGIEYRPYGCECHLNEIMELVSRDLSEPYSIYTYRYFIYNWPNLCFRVSIFTAWSTVSYCDNCV